MCRDVSVDRKDRVGTMAKKYRIELTEEQMRVTQNALEEWFRLRLGQDMDFSNELAFFDYKPPEDEVERDRAFSNRICRRDSIREIMRAVFHIAFSSPYGVPEEKTPDTLISECLWDSIRSARGLSRWGRPCCIGSEPVPKIEVIDDGKN